MKKIHVAAAIICDRMDSPGTVLATARGYGDQKGGWEFPGGKLEPGETAVAALMREIREELDVDITVGDKLHTVEYDYPAFHLTMDCFLCEIAHGQIVLKEAEDARWLTKETLYSVHWLPADLELISLLEEKIKR